MANIEQYSLNLYEACREEFVIPDSALDLGISNVEVKRIRKIEIVDRFLNQFHYLHTSSVFKSIGVITRSYGLYLGGELAGVVVFNPPGSKGSGEFLFGAGYSCAMQRQGTLALSRLVAHPEVPFNGTGYLISQALRMIPQDNDERIRANKAPFTTVVTYADTLFHSGTVYRAQNAWYAGMAINNGLGGFFNPVTGHCINVRQGARTLLKKNCPQGYVPFKASPKVRYLFFLGNRRQKLETMRMLQKQVKLLCKVGKYSVFKEGRLVDLAENRSYEEVYQYFGKIGTTKAHKRYADYLIDTDPSR